MPPKGVRVTERIEPVSQASMEMYCTIRFQSKKRCPNCRKKTHIIHQPFSNDPNYLVCDYCFKMDDEKKLLTSKL